MQKNKNMKAYLYWNKDPRGIAPVMDSYCKGASWLLTLEKSEWV